MIYISPIVFIVWMIGCNNKQQHAISVLYLHIPCCFNSLSRIFQGSWGVYHSLHYTPISSLFNLLSCGFLPLCFLHLIVENPNVPLNVLLRRSSLLKWGPLALVLYFIGSLSCTVRSGRRYDPADGDGGFSETDSPRFHECVRGRA